MELGYAINNKFELNVVKQGLVIARREHYNRLVVEGDSTMVTGLLQRLQRGES